MLKAADGLGSALHRRLLESSTAALMQEAASIRDRAHGRVQTYSPKVFIPLTQLCRNFCHYCTFSQPPRRGERSYLSRDEVIEVARAGAAAGCTEALFTLGDKPELRFTAARDELDRLGHATTISLLAEMCAAVRDETGLLPHVNAGVMSADELALLRQASASQGLMVESTSERLCDKGGPHYRSPDKVPVARIETIRLAGELAIPFTSGILIGIGETRSERLDALHALADLSRRYGHIQEVIVQNFRAKPRTAMANAPEPDLDELLWTIAAARIILDPEVHVQAPPNLSLDSLDSLLAAGIDDWGGVSPVTPDHVNPEARWPEIERLAAETAQAGRALAARLPIYPRWAADPERWLAPSIRPIVLRHSDSSNLARGDGWSPGMQRKPMVPTPPSLTPSRALVAAMERASAGEGLCEDSIVTLFEARGADVDLVCAAADSLRRATVGDDVTYAVNRNINYTNICAYACSFCAFSKGSTSDTLRGKPYDLDHEEIVRRAVEAVERGATELCLQGGIHPRYTGQTYLDITTAIRTALPNVHIHAFSPLEVAQGAATLGVPIARFLERLRDAGLGSLPGTAAEILDDEVRATICPDKLMTQEWVDVIETAHRVGLTTTSTIMFGHVETPRHWARHLLIVRAIQARTAGISEFVPLPFVHMEAPMALKGKARLGPTFREVRLMHAVARLALHPLIPNIQTSWVKLGADGVSACLNGGANDLGGTLMNESISRAAGTTHGQELPPAAMEELILSIGRKPRQRTTLYRPVDQGTHTKGLAAKPLLPIVQTAPRRRISVGAR
jgi:FO synthase